MLSLIKEGEEGQIGTRACDFFVFLGVGFGFTR